MATNITWKIGGEAGLGIMTSGLLFAKAATRSGYHIFDYSEYPSLIRGGHNVVEVRVSDQEVFAQERGVDILVALNKQTIDLHLHELKRQGALIFDQEKLKIEEKVLSSSHIKLLKLPMDKLVHEAGIDKLMQNNLAIGASLAYLRMSLDTLLTQIEEIFARKGGEVVFQNKKAAQLGFDYVKQNYPDGYQVGLPIIPDQEEKLVISGNEAIALGAMVAKCKFYAAYPMTPANSILGVLAAKGEQIGMVVKHAEDEISVINMATGASFAGVRSMIGTSGGGFALMVETVSLLGITETPLVIVMAQRPGPATGMPTWTEQGDLQFVIRSGHGEFPKIVLAPGDVAEAFALTRIAFDLADIYQCPVFIVSDKYLSEGHKSVEKSKIVNQKFKIDRGKFLDKLDIKEGELKEFKRYELVTDGISPRLLPGVKGAYYQSNSYSHLEDGHTTEDAIPRKLQVEKLLQKLETYRKNHLPPPSLYGDPKADLTIVAWGSTKYPVLQAMKEGDLSFNFLHFNYIYPLPGETAEMLKKAKKLLLVENNATAQFGQLVTQETGIEIENKLLKYDGRPLYPNEVIAAVGKLL